MSKGKSRERNRKFATWKVGVHSQTRPTVFVSGRDDGGLLEAVSATEDGL